MALTPKQKAANEADRQRAIANKKGGAVKKNAAEEKEVTERAKKRTITLSGGAKTSAASSLFGGMLGKAASAIKGRKGQGDE